MKLEADDAGIPLDRRLFGTNAPAWIGPERFADPAFILATVESGVSVLRMPGGSWSNSYDWLGCEMADEERCYWTWAARPTDFIDFLQATDLRGMWTVSINGTAEEAAAAVAFFNGDVDDQRPIGTDRAGTDWQTVGTWARLRADQGNPDPIDIKLWEVGNEVYGGKPSAGGEQCAGFGWESVWTCDGAEYILGNRSHDGYIEFRTAMRAVDPDIEVGAVGVPELTTWTNWGNEVVETAGESLDFYVAHHYGFERSPTWAEALSMPSDTWPDIVEGLRGALGDVPIAITEYNLVGNETRDTERSMTRSMNALYIAESIGQLATASVEMANQWNLANGTTSSGTDYGMISLEDGSRFAQFHATEIWSKAGETLMPWSNEDSELRIYPTRHDDGRWTVIVINLAGELRTFDLTGNMINDVLGATIESYSTTNLSSDVMTRESVEVSVDRSAASVSVPGWSISAIELVPNE